MNSLKSVATTSASWSLSEPSIPATSSLIQLYLPLLYSSRFRFIIRDFTFDAEEMEKQRVALAAAEIEEKELWVRSLPCPPAASTTSKC